MATESLRVVTPETSARTAPAAPARDRLDVELMRVVAAVGVICIHVTAYADLENGPRSGLVYWTTLVLDSASRFCVPLFFALAGWVILVRRQPLTLREVWSRLARVSTPFVVWSLLYSIWTHWAPTAVLGSLRAQHALPPLPVDIIVRETLRAGLLGNPVPGHLWFMGTYLPLILLLSLVALVVRAAMRRPGSTHLTGSPEPRLTAAVLAATVGVAALAAAAPTAGLVAEAGGPALDLRWGVPLYSVAFALIGAALLSRTSLPRGTRPAATALAIVTLAVTVWWSWRFPGQPARLYDSPTVVVLTICVLALLLGASCRRGITRVAATLGRASFGIYLVHVMVLYYLHEALDRSPLPSAAIVQAARVPIEVLVTFAVSAALCVTWRRSDRLARLLG